MTHESFWLGTVFGVALSGFAYRLGVWTRRYLERRKALQRLRAEWS